MNRIMIIGGNGAGKTTFARELSAKLDMPLVHLDQLYWKDNWQSSSEEEFNELHLNEIRKPHWIMDGNISRSIPLRLEYCDTVIYFDFSRMVCLYRTLSRVIKNYGKSRSDMGGHCPERFDFEFLKNVWNFNMRNRTEFFKMLEGKEDVQIIVLKNRKQVEVFLENI